MKANWRKVFSWAEQEAGPYVGGTVKLLVPKRWISMSVPAGTLGKVIKVYDNSYEVAWKGFPTLQQMFPRDGYVKDAGWRVSKQDVQFLG